MFATIPNASPIGVGAEPLVKLALVVLGVALLLKGRELLRLLVAGTLFLAGAAASYFVLRHVVVVLRLGPWTAPILSLLIGCLVASTARFPRVCRWTEVIATASLAFWLAPAIQGVLGPMVGGAVTIGVVAAAVVSRAALIGSVAAVAFAAALGRDAWSNPLLLLFVVGVCLAAGWLRFGRLCAEAIQWPRGSLRGRGFGLMAAASGAVPIIAAFDRQREAERFVERCQRRRYAVRRYDGLPCIVEARLPRLEAALLQRFPSVASLLASTPAVIDKAERQIESHRPIRALRSGTEISLEEIRQRLRTGSGNRFLRGRGTNGEGVRVAVIDTGGELRPEYARRVVVRRSVVPDEPDPSDRSECRHGSNVAMIIAVLATGVRLLLIKAFNRRGYAELSWILDAFALAVREGAELINASFGACHCRGGNQCIICRAANGVTAVVCASAGNSGPGARTLSCPGAARATVSVASIDSLGRVSGFSSRGPAAESAHPKPDVAAYGEAVQLRATARGSNNLLLSGTSFGAPQATAAAACVLSAARSKGGQLDKARLRRILRQSACTEGLAERHRDADAVGAGIVSIARAVEHVLGTQRGQASPPRRRSKRPVSRPAAVLARVAELSFDQR